MSPYPIATDLFHSLQQGQLCYVSRAQPGVYLHTNRASKPPTGDDEASCNQTLCNHTCKEMAARGYHGVVIRLAALNEQPSTELEWDKHFITTLWRNFYPANHARLLHWMKATETLSPRERLIQFTNDLLLSELCESPIIILIDSIDDLVHIPAAIDDIFAWIDYCFEIRDTYLSYHHLSFAVFGQVDLSKFDISSEIKHCEISHEISQCLNTGMAISGNTSSNHALSDSPISDKPASFDQALDYKQKPQVNRFKSLFMTVLLFHKLSSADLSASV